MSISIDLNPRFLRKDEYTFRHFQEVFSCYVIYDNTDFFKINKIQFMKITGPADISSDTEVYSLIKIVSSVWSKDQTTFRRNLLMIFFCKRSQSPDFMKKLGLNI